MDMRIKPSTGPMQLYDAKAGRKATNVTVNEDLLRQARAHGINLSRALEERLVGLLAEARREGWERQNAEAIRLYNERVEREGLWNEALRPF